MIEIIGWIAIVVVAVLAVVWTVRLVMSVFWLSAMSGGAQTPMQVFKQIIRQFYWRR